MKIGDTAYVKRRGMGISEGIVTDIFEGTDKLEVTTDHFVVLCRSDMLGTKDEYDNWLNPPKYVPSTRVFLNPDQLEILIDLVEDSGAYEELYNELVDGRNYFE